MNKKSQGLSINTIIIAVLGLLVLVIMVLILTGQTKTFSRNVGCTARDGECITQEDETCPKDKPHKPVTVYTHDCDGKCCITLT